MKQSLHFFFFWPLAALLLCAGPSVAQNRLANGEFEAGNSGFTSRYLFVPAPGLDPGAGSYTVGTDNKAYNPNFPASFGDHTTGTGRYLIANGATTGVPVWEQTVTGLQANKAYQFSFWLLNTFSASKARLQVSANGTDVGPVFSNPTDGSYWQLNTVTVNPGASTQLVLRLRDVNLDGSGNDFGLDDVALTAPVANADLTARNVRTGAISTAATINSTLIDPLEATMRGNGSAQVASFTLASVPAVGTLRLGATGVVVAAGQVLTLGQAGQLYYTPAGSSTQNVTFTYTATDNNGNFSANTATYTVPLVAPAAPTGCGPAYGGGPAASGLTANYYAGYFNDNLGFFANGGPALTRIDPQLNFAGSSTASADGWGNIIPPATAMAGNATNPDAFSTRHRGSVLIPTTGEYTFYLTSDDASYLWLDGAALAPTLANATINNGGLHGVTSIQATVTLAAGLHNLLVYYGENGGGNVLTLEYSSTAGRGISRRIVPNEALCAGPSPVQPVATAATHAPAMPNTNAATAIAPLAGTDVNPGGSVTRFLISRLPAAASGDLYVGTALVRANRYLTAAEAATLSFDPDPAFVGDATFAFFAENNAGMLSNVAAIYTIPVVAPVADVTTTLSGPSTLGAGVSSGSFTATFSNGGPQAAMEVARAVQLPTGASMTPAQQAALPASASYTSSTNTINFGTVAVLNSGAGNSFAFSFVSPTTQGPNTLVSRVGTRTAQGQNTAVDEVTLNVTVGPGNFFVTNDDSNEVPGNATKSGNTLLNDANPANLANADFTATLVSGPAYGALTLNPDGSYSYTPNAGYLGPDSFTYQVCVPSASPQCSNVARVVLNVYDANLVCTIGTGNNLLANPSFSSGNQGFASSYGYTADDPARNNELIPEALYAVGSDAFTYHPSFRGTGRTGAGDNFMIVNGSQNLSIIYQQTVAVRPNTYYSFSAYANSINPGNPAQLGFVINGKSTSTVTTLDGTTNFVRISDLWFSGSTTTAVFEIRDVNKVRNGNDFGLDDLYMGTCAKGLTANNVQAQKMENDQSAEKIPSLSATVTAGPAVGSYVVQTLPATAAGILYLDNTPIIPGQVIPTAQASRLLFDPKAGYNGTTTFTYTATDVSGAGSNNTATYAIPVAGRPLPVELVSFEAKTMRDLDVQLTWRTANELNNDHFEVQRSRDGLGFDPIARAVGQGTTTAPTAYAYTDARIGASAGLLYYRLRQVDRDGRSSYSPVRSVSFGQPTPGRIALYPNPTSATVRLDLTLLPAGVYQVTVLDGVGRAVLTAAGEGATSTPLDVRALAAGSYLVLVRDAEGRQLAAKRLVKE